MKLLLDTNILLDCMMDRQPFAADARKLLILGALGEVDLWMSPSQFTDAFYLLTEGGKPRLAESVKLRLLKVKRLARICTLGGVRHRERAGIVVARLRGRLPLPVRQEAACRGHHHAQSSRFRSLDHPRLRLRRVLRPSQERPRPRVRGD